NEQGYVTGSEPVSANTESSVFVRANTNGWYWIALNTHPDSPLATGAYTIRFLQPSAEGCTPVDEVGLGQGPVNGSLNADTDCNATGDRIGDRYLLELNEPALFRVTAQSSDFSPLVGFYPENSDQ